MRFINNITLCFLLINIFSSMCYAGEIEHKEFDNMLEQPEEHWYELSMLGMKIGHMYIYMEKVDFQGQKMIRSRIDMLMQVKGGGNNIKIETNRIEYADANFKPQYFILTSNVSGHKKIEGKVKNGIAYLTTTLNEKETESEVEVPDNSISDSVAVNHLLSKDKLKIGEKLNYNTFSIDFLQSIPTELSVLEKTKYIHQTKEKEVYILEQKLNFMGGIITRMWVSPDGITYKSETNTVGISMIATKTDKEKALEGVQEIDIMLSTRLFSTGKKPKMGASKLAAHVKLSNGKLKETIITDTRQKLNLENERVGKLLIEIPKIEENECLNLPIEKQELQTFLSSTTYIEPDHPDIHAKATEIIDGEVNSWRAAKKLCEWVYKSIHNKGLSGGYSSSLQTLGSLSGDCTEHTVLMIALARSIGIPARICSGLVFSKDSFYYHFWPEVFVGKWVQMDPSFGQNIADANHIQLQGGILESNTMVEYTEGVFRTINQLDIEIIE